MLKNYLGVRDVRLIGDLTDKRTESGRRDWTSRCKTSTQRVRKKERREEGLKGGREREKEDMVVKK